MKLSSLLAVSLAFVAPIQAQYFSDGWQPGQPVTEQAPPPEYTPGVGPPTPPHETRPEREPLTWSSFSMTKLLESGPVASLFGKIGVNITEQLELAKARLEGWDTRIPLITDENYNDIIVNEELTPEEEEKRVWFVVITAQTGHTGGVSKLIDESFDAAYNNSVIAKDLPDVRWGRIDYLNVTYLTTKWNVWQAPYLAVIRNRGQTLYFYRANQVRLSPDVMHDFLEEENWRQTEPWKSSFAPGGSNEYILHYFALVSQKVYNRMILVPKWILMIISGAIGSVLMRFMHRNPETEVVPKVEPKPVLATPKPILKSAMKRPATEQTPTAPTPSPSKPKSAAKSRKPSKR